MTAVVLALVWLMGIAAVRLMMPAPLRWSLQNAIILSAGAGLGIGIASSLYFVVLALAGPNLVALASVEGAVLVVLVAAGLIVKPRLDPLDFASGPATPGYLTVLFAAAAVIAVIAAIGAYSLKPHGEWDAWSIWNLRARFLFRAGEFWKDAFSSQIAWSHPDYPLLVPAIVAMCWTLAGAETTVAPGIVAFIFTFAAAGTLIATVGILRGKMQSYLAGILLLGSTSFIVIGADQYADVPLSFFILGSLAVLCLEDRNPGDLRLSMLAGLIAGLAAWTKNEGLLFVAALVVARLVALFFYADRSAMGRRVGGIVAGLISPLAVVAFFKLRFAPPNDLLSGPGKQVMAHLFDFGRWVTVIEGFLIALLRVGGFLIPIVLLLALYWYLLRFKVEPGLRVSVATVGFALALMLAGDFSVYVLFPNDVAWQVNTSVERILLQVWPAALLAFFLAVNVPQLVGETQVVHKGKAKERVKRQK